MKQRQTAAQSRQRVVRTTRSTPLGAPNLPPYISHGPLIFWLYMAFGVRGACWFLGVVEWLFCERLFLGFTNRRLGILWALGSIFFAPAITIIPFIPNG